MRGAYYYMVCIVNDWFKLVSNPSSISILFWIQSKLKYSDMSK
jgi:hypothetical protein